MAKHRKAVAVLVAVVLLGAGLVWLAARGGDGPAESLPDELRAVKPALDAAGCGQVETFTSEGRQHLQPGETFDGYETVPATSGRHGFQPLPASPSVFDRQPAVEALVHNLEHGYAVIWHDGLTQGELDRLIAALGSLPKVLVTPIEYADLPGDARVAVTGWQRRLLCRDADPAVIAAVAGYLTGPDTLAPEPGGI